MTIAFANSGVSYDCTRANAAFWRRRAPMCSTSKTAKVTPAMTVIVVIRLSVVSNPIPATNLRLEFQRHG
jgi:hypothetical protein